MIFQISLAILDSMSEKLVNCHDDGEAMTILGSYLEGVVNRDATMHMAHTSSMPVDEAQASKVKTSSFFGWKGTFLRGS